MTDRAPSHLVIRCTVIESHVRQLVRDRGLERSFGDALASVSGRAERARNARDKALVETAIEELRDLARRLAAVPASGETLGDARGLRSGEHAATLARHEPDEGPRNEDGSPRLRQGGRRPERTDEEGV